MTDFAPANNVGNQQFARGLGGPGGHHHRGLSQSLTFAAKATPAVGLDIASQGLRGTANAAQDLGLSALKLAPAINKAAFRKVIPLPQFKGVARTGSAPASVVAKLFKVMLPGV